MLGVARLIALKVLFSPQAEQFLPDGLEPLKLVVRLEGYPSTMRHIRQLKSSSIGMHDIGAVNPYTYELLLCYVLQVGHLHLAVKHICQLLHYQHYMNRQTGECQGHRGEDQCSEASHPMHDLHLHQMRR